METQWQLHWGDSSASYWAPHQTQCWVANWGLSLLLQKEQQREHRSDPPTGEQMGPHWALHWRVQKGLKKV